MRSMLFAATFTLAGASVAQSLQAQSPALTRDFVTQQVVGGSAKTPDLRPVDAPVGVTRSHAGANAVKSKQMAQPSPAAMDPSMRNTLAIIGAIVVVIALVALVM